MPEGMRKRTTYYQTTKLLMTFDKDYFHSARYAEVSFNKYSQYWWSNRYYALLARKHGPKSGRALEIGCGLGHLLGWLTESHEIFGVDVNEWATPDILETAAKELLEEQWKKVTTDKLPEATSLRLG